MHCFSSLVILLHLVPLVFGSWLPRNSGFGVCWTMCSLKFHTGVYEGWHYLGSIIDWVKARLFLLFSGLSSVLQFLGTMRCGAPWEKSKFQVGTLTHFLFFDMSWLRSKSIILYWTRMKVISYPSLPARHTVMRLNRDVLPLFHPSTLSFILLHFACKKMTSELINGEERGPKSGMGQSVLLYWGILK